MAIDPETLELIRRLYWLLAGLAVPAALISVMVTRRYCLARALTASVWSVAAMLAVEAWQGSALLWWQHLGIDFAAFVLITLPPRHYWQSTMGGLVLVQLVLHSCLAMGIDPQWHYALVTLIEVVKCLVLLAWAGGARVEVWLGRLARAAARLVPAALEGKLARW